MNDALALHTELGRDVVHYRRCQVQDQKLGHALLPGLESRCKQPFVAPLWLNPRPLKTPLRRRAVRQIGPVEAKVVRLSEACGSHPFAIAAEKVDDVAVVALWIEQLGVEGGRGTAIPLLNARLGEAVSEVFHLNGRADGDCMNAVLAVFLLEGF